MTVDELHDVMTERLDSIKELIEKQNGRVGRLEDGLFKHEKLDAYRAGLLIGGFMVLSFIWEPIKRRLGW